MADRYREAGVEVFTVRLIPPRRALDPLKQLNFFAGYFPSVFAIARILKRWQADVLHVNTLYNLQGPLAARWAGVPLVWHVRELGRGSAIDRAMLAMVAQLATRAVAISSAVADTLAGAGDRVRLIPNGIDLSEFTGEREGGHLRDQLGIPSHAPFLLVVGRIEPWKGQHVAIEAMPDILRAFPDATLAFVGGPARNKPEYFDALKERCTELGLFDHILFTGIRSDIPLLLAAADVLILPTATAEPFGRTVIEAMAAGCPVVATAAGGPLDSIDDGVTGRLVPPGAPEPLAKAVVDLLGNPEKAHAMARKARAVAHERYSLERVVREMGETLRSAANAH
jgi:glycosyltransferase involved in cell wall biosynthesis